MFEKPRETELPAACVETSYYEVSGGSLQILLTWKDSEKGGDFSFNSTRPLAPLMGTSLPSSVISFILRESHISFFLFSLSTTVFLLLLPN